jgi:hypothetical protein
MGVVYVNWKAEPARSMARRAVSAGSGSEGDVSWGGGRGKSETASGWGDKRSKQSYEKAPVGGVGMGETFASPRRSSQHSPLAAET